ncbi:MAG: type II toxin-antitoxin system HicA family toxin [Proteobacteria bacterium]|nr:type II toxin-antitoxin system HicA family toxin [Pseudomonadota bacterium]MBU4356639.1 type II toxin-antitoxin system HicA family toxin [Pseudomonadota bacterium]MBU4448120.1 type II toxin-antitoxin system HicA family toxin [Pseudomonadota bacterium]MCG2773033.1 type II toxin-antitoxin system HicA family toxin [Desulfobacterales bacterium]
MSAKLPVVSGRGLAKALAKVGYLHDHQKVSHIILRHQAPPYRRITIPDHKEIAKGTLKHIIRETGLTVEELINLL